MRKILTMSVIIALSLISNPIAAQHKSSIFLSDYTYSNDNAEVGLLNISSEGPVTFRLHGKNARLFSIRDNKLFILEKHIKPEVMWYDLEIEATDAAGKVRQSFRLVNDRFIRNRVVAHRGAWKNTGASENSISALQHAIKLGCQGSEFDVHMSADSVLLINHDPHIQNLTIASSSADELRALKLSNGENLPTLEAFLKEGMKQNTTKMVLEIKPTTGKERALQLAGKVVEMVKDLKAQAWIDYISFDYDICLEIQRLDPFARVAYLNGDKAPAVLAADNLWGLDYQFNVFKKNEHWIREAKQKGLTINAWTVNDPEMMQWFLSREIDFITTNEPELLLKIINK